MEGFGNLLLVTPSVVTSAHCLRLIVRPTIVGLEKGKEKSKRNSKENDEDGPIFVHPTPESTI
jgi:hypothetical protein